MAKSGMNPKTFQYIMGHSDTGVTLNTYTHLGYEDAEEEMQELDSKVLDLVRKTSKKRVSWILWNYDTIYDKRWQKGTKLTQVIPR